MASTDTHYDVVIVGGGLCGLTTALRLAQKHKNVVILDQQNDGPYGGGRTRSIDFKVGDQVAKVSVGGTWLAFDSHTIFLLAHELGLYPRVDMGDFRANGVVEGFLASNFLFLKLWYEGYKIVKENPNEWWKGKRAQELDQLTLNQWLDSEAKGTGDRVENQKNGVRQFFWSFDNYPSCNIPGKESNVSAMFCAVLAYLRFANVSRTGLLIPKSVKFEGGTGVFIHAMKEAIAKLGVTLNPNAKVTHIKQDDKGVTVTASDNTQYHGSYVVLAMPPIQVTKITFEPDLSEDHKQINSKLLVSPVPSLNILVGYDLPFWKYNTYVKKTGSEVTPWVKQSWWDPDQNTEFYAEVFEATPGMGKLPDERRPGILRFNCDPETKTSASILKDSKLNHDEKSRRLADFALDWYKNYFEKNEASLVKEFKTAGYINWLDFNAGTTFYYPTGVLSKHGKGLRERQGRVFFGGTERAARSMFWMEGAVYRGHRVAYELLHEFDNSVNVDKEMADMDKRAAEALSVWKKHNSHVNWSEFTEHPIEFIKESIRTNLNFFSFGSKNENDTQKVSNVPVEQMSFTPKTESEEKLAAKIKSLPN